MGCPECAWRRCDALVSYIQPAHLDRKDDFRRNLVSEVLRNFTLTLWNTYSFFVTYANLDKWAPEKNKEIDIQNWIYGCWLS